MSLVVLGWLVACRAPVEPAPVPLPRLEGRPGDVLVAAWPSAIETLNPVTQTRATDHHIRGNVLLPSVRESFSTRLEHNPGLYSSWEWFDSGTRLRVELQEDAAWSDGVPVSVDDVLFTYALLRNPEVASPYGYVTERMTSESPSRVDAHAVEFRFTEAYDRTTQLSHASVTVLPSHLLGVAGPGAVEAYSKLDPPVVSGPWTPAPPASSRPHEVRLVPNASFADPIEPGPRLRGVTLRVIPEYDERFLQLQKGEVDLLVGLQVRDADKLQEHSRLRVVDAGARWVEYVVWNLNDPRFADPAVRRALAMAVDVDGMMTRLLGGAEGTVYGRRAVSTIPPAIHGVEPVDVEPIRYDPDAARALLALAGWKDTDGDDVLDREGEPFSFELMTSAAHDRRLRVATLLQRAFADVGVDARVVTPPFDEVVGEMEARQFEAVLAAWSAELYIDPSDMWRCDTPGQRRPYNDSSYCNPRVDALLDRGLATPDLELALPIWRELQKTIYEDQPYLFLWWAHELAAVDRRFEDVEIDIVSPLHNLHRWQVVESSR